jgi:regulator of sigma E protease
MEFLNSVLFFVIAIGVLVTVHEYGHFWVARRLGVKVLRFSIGFGRAIWSRRAGADQTEYVIAAIPLGGYVKMLDEREGNVAPAEQHRAFNRQPLSIRFPIVLAGPVANFLFAIVAYWVMFVVGVSGLKPFIGEVVPGSIAAESGIAPDQEIVSVDGRPTKTWEQVIQDIIAETLEQKPLDLVVKEPSGELRALVLDLRRVELDDLTRGRLFRALGMEPLRPRVPATIGFIEPDSPADRAGLRPEDSVTAADGEPIRDWQAWVAYVRARPEQLIRVEVERDGARVPLELRPEAVDDEGGTIGRIGAGVKAPTESFDRYYATVRYSPAPAFSQALTKTWDSSALTLRMFWKMVTLQVSLENLSGPISIAQYAGYTAKIGLSRFFEFLAIVSISLGILNLLPIPVLDGGHLLYYCIEFFKGKPVSDEAQYFGQRLGIAMLVGLMGLAFYNDLVRLFG